MGGLIPVDQAPFPYKGVRLPQVGWVKMLAMHSGLGRLVFTAMTAFVGAALSAGCGQQFLLAQERAPSDAPNQDLPPHIFLDAQESAGLDFRHFNGMTGELYLPEITGSGGALFDYDDDGDLDVYLVQGAVIGPGKSPKDAILPWHGSSSPRDQLYRNDLQLDSNGVRRLNFTNVTNESTLVAEGYGMGVTVGDINDDGRLDLYVTNLASNQMFLNQGDGTFSDVTRRSGTDDPRWSTSAAFLDYDRDGRLDLFVSNYVDFSVTKNPTCYATSSALDYCGPDAYQPLPDRLFRNRGEGIFEDVSSKSGIDREFGAGLGVATADFNGDGWTDIYVANDGDPNQLWVNQKDGTFRNEALWSGAALNRVGQAEAGMGVDAADFDGDGDEDLFVTHLTEETNTLYVNQGNGLFDDRTIETGLHMPSFRFTGFGTGWLDFDNDGWLDLLALNGAVRILPDLAREGHRYPLGQSNQLFQNTGKLTFRDLTNRAGASFQLKEVSRGAALGDVDNDGDTDILVLNNSGASRLLLNQVGNRRHWLGLSLLGKEGRRDMLEARVEVLLPNDSVLWRRVRTGGSYCSSHDPRVLVGLGAWDRVRMVRVHWPSGQVEEWRNLKLDRYTTIREGRAPDGN